MRQRDDVQVDDLELTFEVGLVEVTMRFYSGVVHQRDDAVIDGSHARGEMLTIESPRKIRREYVAHDAVALAERTAECLERLTTARDEDEVVPIARVQVGEVSTDSARRARNDRDWTTLTAPCSVRNR